MEYQKENISPNNLEDCTKCTICTVYCPVSAVNPDYPGPKKAGPDGERYRLKNPKFYDNALKFCLNCKRCEVACPSNVKIGDIIQQARLKYDTKPVSLRDRMLASTDFVGSFATKMSPLVNLTLKMPLAKTMLHSTIGVDKHRTLPRYASSTFESYLKRDLARQEKFPKKVAYYHGCYVNYNNPDLGIALVRLMNAVGYGVMPLSKERCCGVAKIANKLIKEARRDADININAIKDAAKNGLTVIASSSTCVFTIREEYQHLLGMETADVRNNIFLATAFLNSLLNNDEIKLVFRKDYRARIAYHTACHMQKLGWRIHSMSLLKSIPGVTLVPLDPVCCGMAGTYGFKKENYSFSQAIGKDLFDRIYQAGVDIVATDCETCKWQIEPSTGVRVENPITILAEALDWEATRRANCVPDELAIPESK